MILLTGASGFIGGHLLHKLVAVYGYDNVIALTSQPIDGAKYMLHNGYAFDSNFTENADWQRIKTVIHAGAFTPKNGPEAADWVRCNENIINTDSLLKALPGGVERVIFLSTLDIYGDTEVIVESSPIAPVSLYGDSKLYCERMVEVWGTGNKVAQVLRIGHVYGPGEEKYQKIIPNTLKKVLADAPLQITGTGNDVRSFIYITDVVDAVVKSIGLAANVGPVNIVGKESITIKELVLLIQEIAGNTKSIDYVSSDKKVRNLYFDNSKMNTLLCEEKYNLRSGLAEEWAYMVNGQ